MEGVIEQIVELARKKYNGVAVERTSVVNLRLTACPDCGSRLPYVRINLVQPFECPSCGKTLVVPPEYNKRIQQVCLILTIGLPILFVFVWKNTLLFLLAPIFGFLLPFLAHIIWKRIFPPEIEDHDNPRYMAL